MKLCNNSWCSWVHRDPSPASPVAPISCQSLATWESWKGKGDRLPIPSRIIFSWSTELTWKSYLVSCLSWRPLMADEKSSPMLCTIKTNSPRFIRELCRNISLCSRTPSPCPPTPLPPVAGNSQNCSWGCAPVLCLRRENRLEVEKSIFISAHL